jgi:hypothetical protein
MTIVKASMVAFAVVAATLSFAEGPSGRSKRSLPPSSPIYDCVESLYLERGYAIPCLTRPWSVDQVESMLDEIGDDGLSEAGRRALDEARRLLDWKPIAESGRFAFRAGLELSPEAFFHFRLDGDDDYAYDRQHGAERRSSLLNVPLQAAIGSGLFLELDAEAREEFDAAGTPGNFTNLVIDDPSVSLDLNTPFTALCSAGSDWWTIRFGRSAISWGNGETGNFMLSDWDEYHDYLGFDLYGGNLSFSGVYIAMEPYGFWDRNGMPSYDPRTGWGDSDTPEIKKLSSLAFVGHRLEYRPSPRLRIAIAESCIISDDGDPAHRDTSGSLIRDLNPLMIFHDWNTPWRTNSLATAELSWSPWKSVEAYGQFAMDEMTTAYEASGDGGGGPFVGAWLAGAKAAVPLGPGYLTGALEYARTSPWLYNRDADPARNEGNAACYYDVRRYWSLAQGKTVYLVKTLGYAYGSDAVVLCAQAGYSKPGSFSISLDFRRTAIGERGMGARWEPSAGDAAPSGTPEIKNILHSRFDAALFGPVSLGGDAYLVGTENEGHVAGAGALDAEIALRVRTEL